MFDKGCRIGFGGCACDCVSSSSLCCNVASGDPARDIHRDHPPLDADADNDDKYKHNENNGAQRPMKQTPFRSILIDPQTRLDVPDDKLPGYKKTIVLMKTMIMLRHIYICVFFFWYFFLLSK